ncbi:MAG TPA: PEGA domain-containing protein [Verrucomicrobiae bacterium]|nr:PEGA domain-containing protein [Verrucomicrobiae bacterium]
MNTSKLAGLTLLSISLALASGCSTVKKSSAAKPEAAPADAAAPAPAVAAAAPEEAKPEAKPAAPAKPKAPVLKDVIIRSTPAGATVLINGQDVGVTPLVATQLDRAKRYDVSLMLPGYLIANTTIRSVAHVVAGPAGKSSMASFSPAALPNEVHVALKTDKDPYKALTAAIVDLDSQLKKGQITPIQYKEKSAEVARFYGQAK